MLGFVKDDQSRYVRSGRRRRLDRAAAPCRRRAALHKDTCNCCAVRATSGYVYSRPAAASAVASAAGSIACATVVGCATARLCRISNCALHRERKEPPHLVQRGAHEAATREGHEETEHRARERESRAHRKRADEDVAVAVINGRDDC
eukprot:6193099-Pleurochrysis_carterae.AAC.2